MSEDQVLIVIPARYGSSRFPGKPLVKIAGKEMILRVWENANKAVSDFTGIRIIVATEDTRIKNFCDEYNMDCLMTTSKCKSGTDRVREVIATLGVEPDFVINLQGDNPMCPPWFVTDMIRAYQSDKTVNVITPITQLSWAELDALRQNKTHTPLSGTTVVVDNRMNALWFSKKIIPAIRKEQDLRKANGNNLYESSPVFRHIGLYGYVGNALEIFAALPEGMYEKIEGLEQLRFIENGYSIRTVKVDYKGYGSMSGIDEPEDVRRAEELFIKYGEF